MIVMNDYKPYVYHVHDTVTGMWYLGSKTAKGCNPENTKDYLGSPKDNAYKQVIKTRPETLVKTIVAVCQTAEDALKFEERLLRELKANKDPMSYNRNITNWKSGVGRSHSDVAKAKMSAKGKGRQQSAEHIAKRLASIIGKPRSPETKAKISAAQVGKRLGPRGPYKRSKPSMDDPQ